MIKEIPILFSTAMVQAELDDRKTMTRRTTDLESINERPDDWEFVKFEDNAKGGLNAIFKRKDSILHTSIPCRYGRPNDLLWVRESWQLKGWDFEEGTMKVQYVTGETFNCLAHDPDEDSSWLMDKVDWLEDHGYIKPDPTNEEVFVFTDKKQPFKPSIHMPKEAARIWLQVTDVRVERLKDISEQDAIAEGIIKIDYGMQTPNGSASVDGGKTFHPFKPRQVYGYSENPAAKQDQSFQTARTAYGNLWERINGPDSWQANPWVWVIGFRLLSTTGKPDLNNL